MFVCPKCGYRELSCWRRCRFIIYGVYCHITELEPLDQELAQKIRESPHYYEDEYYGYHMSKTGYVTRVPKEYKNFLFEHDKAEKHRPKDRNQPKLFDVVNKCLEKTIAT